MAKTKDWLTPEERIDFAGRLHTVGLIRKADKAIRAAEERAETAESQGAYLLYITRAWLEGLGEKRIASRTNIEALEAGIFKQLPEGARAMVEKVKILQEIASFWAPLGEHSTQAERERLQQCLDRAAKLDAKKGKS